MLNVKYGGRRRIERETSYDIACYFFTGGGKYRRELGKRTMPEGKGTCKESQMIRIDLF
jgi:hypothetical protein